jgi:TonB family protein
MRRLSLALVACCVAAALHGQDGLSVAQALYGEARYEEALKAFDALKTAGGQAAPTVLTVEQGRAFCLLALDRRAEADRSIEAILGLDPFYKPPADDTPPKIRTAFREVRRRALGGVLQQLYQQAKAAYERKAYAEAAAGFSQVTTLLDDEDLVLDDGPRGDMRLVARAFEDLAKATSAPPPAAPPAAAPPSAPADGGRPASEPARGAVPPAAGAAGAAAAGKAAAAPIYDALAKDVTPPVAQRTDVPIPNAIRNMLPNGEVVVEVVVSATGAIETATARVSPDPLLGATVARAALDWRYRPATRQGAPVRYRMSVKVVVARQP